MLCDIGREKKLSERPPKLLLKLLWKCSEIDPKLFF